MPPPVYLDNHATTRLDPAVYRAMCPWLDGPCGNPSSPHAVGRAAREAVEAARASVASLIGARAPESVVFTPGATAANNVAILGFLGARAARRGRRGRVVVGAIEHKSVLEAARAGAQEFGFEYAVAPVDAQGRVRQDALRPLLEGAVLLSVQLANNEIGTIQDVAALASLAKAKGAAVHVDATQGAGKVAFDMGASLVDMVSLAAHKMHGPKGAGALAVAPGVELKPIMYGGSQELGLWPGTHNVPAIVGFGVACDIAAASREREAARVGALRNLLAESLLEHVDDFRVVGPFAPGAPPESRWPGRLPGNLSVLLPGVSGRSLVERMGERVCMSTGSACNCPNVTSEVLHRIGVRPEDAKQVVRFGLGRFTTREEVLTAAAAVGAAAAEMRRGRAAA